MATPKQWAIQRIFDMTVKNVAGTKVHGTIKDLKEVNLENGQENVFSMGGAGNPYINSFSHSKRVTGNATAASYSNAILALITGTDVVTGKTVIPFVDELRIKNDEATLTQDAEGEAGSEILAVEILGSGGVVETLKQGTTASATDFEFAVGTGKLSFLADKYDDDTLIRVYYHIETTETAHTIANKADEMSKTVRLEMRSLVRDCDDNEFAALIIVYKAKLTGNWNLTTAADGDPSTLDVSFEGMKRDCANSDFWKMVVYDLSTAE